MTMKWIAALVAALTILLPTDLVPDVVPVLGWLDDILAVLLLVYQITDAIRERRAKRLQGGQQLPQRR